MAIFQTQTMNAMEAQRRFFCRILSQFILFIHVVTRRSGRLWKEDERESMTISKHGGSYPTNTKLY